MIPYIVIGLGIILMAWSGIGFIRLMFLPLTRMSDVVFKRLDDFLKYNTSEGQKYFKKNLKQLVWAYVVAMLTGLVLFFLGIYLGYAAEGDSFWFYQKVFGVESHKEDTWDKITEEGKYKSDDGNEYTFYILVNGDRYIFSGEECESLEDLKERLSGIKRENTVMLIDGFAISSYYKQAEKLLNELGIKYETEED